jgi:hypothetical protein
MTGVGQSINMSPDSRPDWKKSKGRIRSIMLWIQEHKQNITHMFEYLILLLALLFAAWLFLKIFLFGISLVVSRPELMIMPFDGSEAEKKDGPAILSAKLRELKTQGGTAPTGYGLLNVPVLKSGPQQTEQTPDRALAGLDKIQLKIKDVDVPALIRAFNALLAPAQYELRGSVVKLPASISVICRLERREKVIASWEARGKTSEAGDKAKASTATLEDLLDQVLYQMIFDFIHNTELKNEWRISITSGESFANWQSLRSYVRGLRALRSYQETLEHGDLEEASKCFESLTKTDPANKYGLYFRGLTLSEDRQEAKAYDTFVQLEHVLWREAESATGKPMPAEGKPMPAEWKAMPAEWKAMLREARLNAAITRLKLYRFEPEEHGNKAVNILEDLIDELKAELPSEILLEGGPTPKKLAPTLAYTTKLLTICYAQLAYTHGTILSFLRHEKEGPSLDTKVSDHETEMNANLRLATGTFNKLENSWTPSGVDGAKGLDASANPPKEAAQAHKDAVREKLDVQFRIENAQGYGEYRLAFFRKSKKPAKKGESPYQEACKKAIKCLEEANEHRPNHYEVIQNLAMIYADEDYDPNGDSLPQAKWLFERTKLFVPNDYYQFEQLAKIHLRLMGLCSTDECRSKEITDGIEEAKGALVLPIELRGQQSASALHTMALLLLNKWELEKNDANAKAALDAIQDAIPFAIPPGSVWQAAKEKLRTFALERVKKVIEDTKDTQKAENVEPHAHALQTLALLLLNKWKLDKQDNAAAKLDKQNNAATTEVLDAIQNAIPFPQSDTAWQAYMDFLETLADTRSSSPTLSNEVIDRVISLARVPKLESAARDKLKTFALTRVNEVIKSTETSSKPEDKDANTHAKQSKTELDKL